MSPPGSVPRSTYALHPLLSVLAVVLGTMAMTFGILAVRVAGLHVGLIVAETLLILPGLALLAGARVPARPGLALYAVRPLTALLAVGAGATLWAASLGLMNLQFALWPPPQEFLKTFEALHEALRPRSVGGALLSVAAIAVAPAVCEEILFRGIVLPSLSRLGAAVGLAGSALLFALIHVDTTPGGGLFFHRLPFAFTVGIGLGALRLATGSLLPAMAAHAAINTITFSTVFLTGAAASAMDEPHLGLGLGLLLFGGAATAALVHVLRRATLLA